MNGSGVYKNRHLISKVSAVLGLSLTLCLGATPIFAQQNQGSLPGYPVATGQPPSSTPDNDSAQSTSPAPADQASPTPQSAPQQPVNPQNMPEQATLPSNQTVPASLIAPAGTVIEVRTNEWLSTDRNLPGDGFNATLAQPIVVDGWVVAQRGQEVLGRVTVVDKGKSSNHTSQLGLQLSELTFVDGQLLPIQTQLVQSTAPSDHGRDVATVGTTTGAGAIIGAIAGGGPAAAVGAGVGAIAGIGIITTHGKPTMIPPETLLTFRLDGPVTISTVKSQFAFHPVTQADYNASNQPRRLMREGGYPPPPSYAYPYAYDPYFYPYGWGFYPGPVFLGFGYYGGYRHFGRFR